MNKLLNKKLSIGTAQIGFNYGAFNKGKRMPLNEIKKIIYQLNKKKIINIDTASDYKKSESVLGKFNLKKINVTTKISFKDVKNIEVYSKNKINDSLKKLKIKKIYGVLIHDFDLLKASQLSKIFKSLSILKKKGLISKIGISVYNVDNLIKILPIYKSISIVQLSYNVFDRRLENKTLKLLLKKNKIEIHARSIFLQGVLLQDPKFLPIKFKKWKNILNDWHKFLQKNNYKALYYCLHFALINKDAKYLVCGIDNFEQLNEILNYKPPKKYKKYQFKRSKNIISLINPSLW